MLGLCWPQRRVAVQCPACQALLEPYSPFTKCLGAPGKGSKQRGFSFKSLQSCNLGDMNRHVSTKVSQEGHTGRQKHTVRCVSCIFSLFRCNTVRSGSSPLVLDPLAAVKSYFRKENQESCRASKWVWEWGGKCEYMNRGVCGCPLKTRHSEEPAALRCAAFSKTESPGLSFAPKISSSK